MLIRSNENKAMLSLPVFKLSVNQKPKYSIKNDIPNNLNKAEKILLMSVVNQ